MKYYSECLKKFYDTAEECDAAEAEAIAAKKKAEEEKERLLAERKVRAEEIAEARKVMVDAQNTYEDLIRDFVRDYGSYHYSTTNTDEMPKLIDSFDWLWRF